MGFGPWCQINREFSHLERRFENCLTGLELLFYRAGGMEFKGIKIKKYRELRKWSQKQFAQKMISTGHFTVFSLQKVRQLEAGNNASHRDLCALCEVFKCTPNAFFGN